MLKGISPLLSRALLGALCEMGHGDEIVLGDAHFPAATLGRRVIRADGRFDFYERARQAFAVVATGDTATYANVMLRKGVTPSP